MFTDEILLEDIWMHLKTALDCSIEALCVLLFNPDLHLHRSLLHTDKCFKTTCSCLLTQLGICINKKDLNLSIPDTKREHFLTILSTSWNSSRKRFTLREVASLLALTSNLALTTQWVEYTCITLQQALLSY